MDIFVFSISSTFHFFCHFPNILTFFSTSSFQRLVCQTEFSSMVSTMGKSRPALDIIKPSCSNLPLIFLSDNNLFVPRALSMLPRSFNICLFVARFSPFTLWLQIQIGHFSYCVRNAECFIYLLTSQLRELNAFILHSCRILH